MSTSRSSIEVEVSPEYQIPSYFCLLKNFDSIYASGLFCHIAKMGKKRDQQLRLVWAVEQMLGNLREVRDENLQSRSPFFHAKRYLPPPTYFCIWAMELNHFPPNFSRSAKHKISSQFNLKPTEDELPLNGRLEREIKLYKEARKRLKRGKPLRFVPDYDNLTRAHRQLSASLKFFSAAMHWMGMPTWRKPYLEFEWAPPLPDSSLPSRSVDKGVLGLEVEIAAEQVKTPELLRTDSEKPSIADSETTLVADTLADTGDDEHLKGPPESSRSARSFGLIQSFCSFISDPGNPSVSF